jgi:hypothetical protein
MELKGIKIKSNRMLVNALANVINNRMKKKREKTLPQDPIKEL